MSNLPPNHFQGPPGQQAYPNQYNQVPFSQMNYPGPGLTQDANSNSPLPPPNLNNTGQNHLSQSASNSPAFNAPGMLPPRSGTFSPTGHPVKPVPTLPPSNIVPPTSQFTNTNSAYPPNSQYRQINDNAPPHIPSSQPYNPNENGPSSGLMPPAPGQYPPGMLPPGQAHNFGPPSFKAGAPTQPIPPSSISGPVQNSPLSMPPVSSPAFGPPRPLNGPSIPTSSPMPPTIPNSAFGPTKPMSAGQFNGPNVPLNGRTSAPLSGPPASEVGQQSRSAFPVGPSGQPSSQPAGSQQSFTSPALGPMGQPSSQPASQPPMGLPKPSLGPSGPQSGPSGHPVGISRPQFGPSGPQPGPSLGPNPPTSGYPPGPGAITNQPSSLPPSSSPYPGPAPNLGPPGPQSRPPGPLSGPHGQQSRPPGPLSGPPTGLSGPPLGPPLAGLSSGPGQMPPHSMPGQPNMAGPMGNQGPQSMPPMGVQGPPQGPGGNMQNRYPQMPQNYNQQPQNTRPYPQYGVQDASQQLGQMSVTKQGFDQLWGHQTVDLMQCRHVLPEQPEPPPEIRLVPQFAEAANCSPEIFRCTINRIPETNSLLQKSRLPLGILIHPFKDLNHLPVIQCATIVRCRACRTYINPFVYFVDSKRWKCNLCYRVNDLPEEFQYDPVSKSYGDPSRRPEVRSATIEFIAPGEYMLRPPQPAVYLFLLDVSQLARESGYLEIFCNTLLKNLNQLPGDARTQVGFICYDAHIHYYLMEDGLTRPKEMTVLDIEDVFLPSPESLLVNLGECRDLITELLTVLPRRHASVNASPACALGAALQAAYKLMAPTGGRITVFQTCLPNVGPGALQPREDPNARSSKDVAHLNPATDFYKRLALDCSGAQVAVDLFLLNSQYSDLATLSGMSKFSGGSVHHIPLFKASRSWQAAQLQRMFTRYITRKIGFEAVMRVRCTRGITIHTFHGNFFVRSTDLLSLPNVSPDSGFGMQLAIEESLADLQQVCFQAALLYTSSKGERRIRVHTLALPIASNLPDVLHAADQQCIIGLLSKMAVDRCVSASMSEAKEALINVAIDVLSAHKLAANLPHGAGLLAPANLRLLPLYLLATLKRKSFRTGTSTRLDDRVADMCDMKSLPLSLLMLRIYPDLYPVHEGRERPPRLQLSAEKINSTGAYLLDEGDSMILYIGHAVSPAFLSGTFGVTSFNQLPDEARSLPEIEDGDDSLHRFIDELNSERPYEANLLILRDNSPSRTLFTERLIEDRVESAFSYYEFLQHVKSQIK